MITSPAQWTARRRLVAAISGGLALVAVVIVGLYGLAGDPEPGPSVTLEPVGPLPQTPPTGAPTDDPSTAPELPVLPETNDAVPYAREVANALFTWDTMSGLTPRDYANVLIADADPSGIETSGLVTDVTTYLPADDVWRQLRQYETRQWLEVYGIQVPSSWGRIVSESRGQIPDGTWAVTVRAYRHREGVWEGQQDTTREKVAFTVFVGCPPRFDERCHLLRLSELGNPL
ncbi:hypothetical protein [Jiangella alba]|uniref:Uncharacterized protein n=1 Tax=Jiangella alba TaxID=561176 RepID=A0A1H5N1E4_9ACTN|nr:hypothetical protein [Jiangella alba]SEE94468.1 hypothetical protein SAMN04488561_3553 [Jiangella alba]